MDVLAVMGTRPEVIKMAPVVAELDRHPHLRPVIALTGQHRQMADDMVRHFGLHPDHDLRSAIPQHASLTDLTSAMLVELGQLIAQVQPAAVVVQGDTASALAGAMAAFQHRVPVVHVEAGLRTGDPTSPFPEETNRRLISVMTNLHMVPTHVGRANLLAEGYRDEHITITGNTVIDALLATIARDSDSGAAAPETAGPARTPRRMLLVTAHRRESWDHGLAEIARALRILAAQEPDLHIVFPIHANPIVRQAIRPLLDGGAGISVLEPLPYPQLVRLLAQASIVLTDSGGIQEEAVSLGKPTLVARDTTERPEGIAAGGAELVGTDARRIVERVTALLHDRELYASMSCSSMPFGDGHAAKRITDTLWRYLGESRLPALDRRTA